MIVTQTLKKKVINQTIRLSPILGKYSSSFFANQLQNPVFIIGCARSGTTLLASLLGEHHDIANWSEANHIWDPQWYPWRPSNKGIWPMEFDSETFTRRWWRHAQSRQEEIKATFGAYQWFQQKPCFLNKSPFNTFRIPYLLTMFPNARFIHLVRDGRAVAHSYTGHLTRKGKLQEWPDPQQSLFTKSSCELTLWLASFWKASLEEVDRQDNKLELRKKGILLDITYEKLCENPSGTLNSVCQYLSLDPVRFTPVVREKQLKNQNHKWQESLDTTLVTKIVAAMQPTLTQWGYVSGVSD